MMSPSCVVVSSQEAGAAGSSHGKERYRQRHHRGGRARGRRDERAEQMLFAIAFWQRVATASGDRPRYIHARGVGHRELFLGALPDAARAALAVVDDLGVILSGHLEAARRAWPEIRLPDDAFLPHLARRLADNATDVTLRSVRASDVYLACACALGDPAAIAIFERTYFGEVDAAAVRVRAGESLAAEAKQILRLTLFVSGGTRVAAAATFSGRGDLRGWLRIAATRELLRLAGRDRREVRVDDDALLDALAPAVDPELGYLRDLYRDACNEAFRAALAGLSPRHRSLLRYQLIDGLSIDQIGAVHGVHRATAARWLSRARDDLVERARFEVAQRLGVATAEASSILRLVQSRLDVSMERALRSESA